MRCLAIGVVLALALPLTAFAGVITSIEPTELKQGDTALLTIRGTDLPSGVLAIEFYPQHIAVVSILSQSKTELTAQVKVPALAPPGAYNVLVFNQIGEEAFGQGLLTITSTVLTPVFKNYDPKVIARADSAFALLLTGDAITPEATAHLSADWHQGEHALGGMYTTFSYAGGSVMCAVTGRLPTGRIRGRIKMDNRPIYQLEIEIRGPSSIIGHTPTSMPAAPGLQVVKLVGSDFSAPFLSQVTATLRRGRQVVQNESVVLRDGATAELEFPGPLPEGELTLSVSQDGVIVYEGPLRVLPPLPVPEPVVAPPKPAPVEQEPQAEPEPEVPQVPLRPEVTEPLPEIDLDPTVFQEVQLDPTPRRPVVIDPPVVASTAARISSVTPTELTSDGAPFRIVVSGSNLPAELIERLSVQVEAGGASAEQQLSMATGDGLTYMFMPPPGGWNGAAEGTIRVSDPAGVVPTYEQPLTLPGGMRALDVPAPMIEQPAASGDWRLLQAFVNLGRGNSALTVSLSSPLADWEPNLLSAEFVLSPDNPRLVDYFTNFTTAGELSFRRNDAVAIGALTGNFPSGALLLKLRYADGPVQLITAQLDAPTPTARVTAPQAREVSLDAQGRAKPAELRWGLDFSPLAPSPSLPVSIVAPEVELASLAAGVRGTTLIISQPLTSLGEADSLALLLQLPEGISAEVGTLLLPISRATQPAAPQHPLPTAPAQPTLDEPAVDEPAIDGQRFQLLPLSEAAQIDEGGFSLRFELSGTPPSGANWGNAELATEHMMLGPNVAKFAVAADVAAEAEKQVLTLHFRRNRAELPDMAFEVLSDDLVASSPVALRLGWPKLGIAVEVQASFEMLAVAESGEDESAGQIVGAT